MKKLIGLSCMVAFATVIFNMNHEEAIETSVVPADSTLSSPNSNLISKKLRPLKTASNQATSHKLKTLLLKKEKNRSFDQQVLTFKDLDFSHISQFSTADLYRIFADMFPDYAMMSHFSLEDERNLAKLIEELSSRLPSDGMVAKARLSPLGIQNPIEFNEHLEAHLPRAIELRPNDFDLVGVDMYLAVVNNETDVEASLLKLIHSNPGGVEGELYLAGHYYQKGEMLNAYKWFSKASEKDPENPLVVANKDFFTGKSSKLAILKLNGVLYKRRIY